MKQSLSRVFLATIFIIVACLGVSAQEPTKVPAAKQNEYKDEQAKKDEKKIEPISENKVSSQRHPMYPSQEDPATLPVTVKSTNENTPVGLKPAIDADESNSQPLDSKDKTLKKKKKIK